VGCVEDSGGRLSKMYEIQSVVADAGVSKLVEDEFGEECARK
jgi:hypothetical protein